MPQNMDTPFAEELDKTDAVLGALFEIHGSRFPASSMTVTKFFANDLKTRAEEIPAVAARPKGQRPALF